MAVTTTPQTGEARGPAEARSRIGGGLLDPKILWKSLPDAFKKLDPRVQIKNPVMFVVEVGSVLTLYTAIRNPSVFNWTIVVWLWLTVVFANLAEAVAEGRGKAQAETLRRTKRETVARRLVGWRPGQTGADLREEAVPGTQLTLGGIVMLLGRFAPEIFALGLAGSLARQQPVPASAGTLDTRTPLFVGMLVGVILILVGLTYFPALALGPFAEGLH